MGTVEVEGGVGAKGRNVSYAMLRLPKGFLCRIDAFNRWYGAICHAVLPALGVCSASVTIVDH